MRLFSRTLLPYVVFVNNLFGCRKKAAIHDSKRCELQYIHYATMISKIVKKCPPTVSSVKK